MPDEAACNLRGESRLSSALAALESLAATWKIPYRSPVQGEHLARGPIPLPVPPPTRYIERLALRKGRSRETLTIAFEIGAPAAVARPI